MKILDNRNYIPQVSIDCVIFGSRDKEFEPASQRYTWNNFMSLEKRAETTSVSSKSSQN
jgi:hypothetical protein